MFIFTCLFIIFYSHHSFLNLCLSFWDHYLFLEYILYEFLLSRILGSNSSCTFIRKRLISLIYENNLFFLVGNKNYRLVVAFCQHCRNIPQSSGFHNYCWEDCHLSNCYPWIGDLNAFSDFFKYLLVLVSKFYCDVFRFLSFYPLWAMLCSLEMCSHNFDYFWKICNYYLLYTSFPPFSLVYYFKLLLSMYKTFYFHLLHFSIFLTHFISPKGLWSIVKIMIMKFRIVIIRNVHGSYKREHPSERKLIPTSSRFALPGVTIHLIIHYKSTYMLATIGTWWDKPNSDWLIPKRSKWILKFRIYCILTALSNLPLFVASFLNWIFFVFWMEEIREPVFSKNVP